MTFATILAAIVLAISLCFAGYYVSVSLPRKGTLDWVSQAEKQPFTFCKTRYPMEKKDALPVLLITAIYAFTAFFSLGSTKAPQSYVDLAAGKSVTYEISGDAICIASIRSYANLGTGGYNLEISADGETWSTLWTRTETDEWGKEKTAYYWAMAEGYEPSYALAQPYTSLFKWVEITTDNPQYARYIRLTGKADYGQKVLRLGKLIFLDENGEILRPNFGLADGSPMDEGVKNLLDVDAKVPTTLSWFNSTYFDEIYHPRTALEHLEGITPYENTHPPLGKLIIALGIQIFGMTPFGWRFMGTLFGVAMLPILYIFLKNMFGKSKIAACGTILLATEFMHLTQTRIATIDTYGVFFILVSYLFFYRWLTAPATTNKAGKTSQGYFSLALSGIFFGVGCASKWTVVYAGAGLAVLYLIHFVLHLRSWPGEENAPGRGSWAVKTLGLSVLCFVLIPAVIYTASYIPYAAAKQENWTVMDVIGEMGRNQVHMLTYHQGVHSTHPYESRWYQWLVDGRPILYYLNTPAEGFTQRFASFNNPLISWAGLLCLAAMLWRSITRRCGKGVFLFVGFLAQFLPWVFISRTTFAYHYFPSVLFLIFAICYVWNDLMENPRARWKLPLYGVTAGSCVLYAMFYPVLIGLAVPTWYSGSVLRFLPSWPL